MQFWSWLRLLSCRLHASVVHHSFLIFPSLIIHVYLFKVFFFFSMFIVLWNFLRFWWPFWMKPFWSKKLTIGNGLLPDSIKALPEPMLTYARGFIDRKKTGENISNTCMYCNQQCVCWWSSVVNAQASAGTVMTKFLPPIHTELAFKELKIMKICR